MKKFFTFVSLLIGALTASVTANGAALPDATGGGSGIEVVWESYPGWIRDNVASVYSVGITTPGTTDNTYVMSDFSFAQETGTGQNDCYAAIATESINSESPISQDKILAFSSNSVRATATEWYTYTLEEPIELTGATTYYIIFFTDKTLSAEGTYTPCTQRISLSLKCGNYAPGVIAGNGSAQSTWTPGFRATLIVEELYNVTYTCKSTYDDSVISSGTIEDVVVSVAAPALDGYAFSHATEADGTRIDNLGSYTITEDKELIFYYVPFPKANTFFRIKGKTSGNYIAAGNVDRSTMKYNMSDAQDATTIFYYADDKLLNYSSGLYNGMRAGQVPGGWDWMLGPDDASLIEFSDGNTNGGLAIKSHDDAYFYDAGTYTDRGSSPSGERYTNWIIESVESLPVTIGETGWATFAAPVATEIAEGVTAYTASAVEGEVLTLVKVEGGIIPANTGVLLQGDADTYEFAITSGGSVEGNIFSATIAAEAVAAKNNYVLANGNNGLGFYLLNDVTMPGFKAYLPVSATAAASMMFRFAADNDDDLTGIAGVEAEGAEAICYDLQGRRVAAPQKGQLYIVNGKKVLY